MTMRLLQDNDEEDENDDVGDDVLAAPVNKYKNYTHRYLT